MQVIHFTEGATDPLLESHVRGARFVPLAEGSGRSQLGCLHLAAGGRIPQLPVDEDCAVLTVQGEVSFTGANGLRLVLSGGVGILLDAGERCALESPGGAVLILLKCQHLAADESGLSTPQRISGQRWPGETPADID